MADKSFGVKELNLLNASGTPTVTSPNNLNLNANTVAISTSCTIGNNLTVTSTTNSANLNVTGIGTLTRGFATDLSVSGISTISQPSNANPHSLWDVVNNSSSAYRFTGPGQDGAEDNPNIYLVRGQRYIFKVNASGHPFQLRVANGGAAYSDGVTNNGAQSGNVVINVQHDAPAQLYYQCTSHGGMVGNIYIVGGPQVISGVITATSFSGSGANLTNLPAQATIANNADNRVITGGSGVNLNGEANLTFDGSLLTATNTGSYAAHIGGSVYYFKIGQTSTSSSPRFDAIGSNVAIPFALNGTEKVRIDQYGNLLVGASSYQNGGFGGTSAGINIAGTQPQILLHETDTDKDGFFGLATSILRIQTADAIPVTIWTNDTERLRIDSNGDLGLGISAVPQDSGARTLHIHDSDTGSGARAAIRLTHGSSGSSASNGAFIGFDNNPDFYIYNQESGRLRFGVGGSEKLRINSSGKLATAYSTSQLSDYAQLDVVGNDGTGGVIRAFMDVNSTAVGYSCLELRHVGARPGQDAYGARFKNSGGGVCGSILLGQSTAAFNTSSDYRLKENVVAISDGITRLKTLKPYRFNWIEEKGKPKVDGFFAHEVTAVPEAIKGTKDQVDENGNPEYQQIDQSKLVPLLTAALQEAITKIETLESKVAALEGS